MPLRERQIIRSCVIALTLVVLASATAHAQERDDLSFYKEQSETTSPGKHADLYRDLPRDPGEDDWKQHRQAGDASSGGMGEALRAALEKKKR